MRILLTGITGYLGSHLAKAILNRGDEVIGLKRRSSSLNRIDNILPKLVLHDLEDTDLSVLLSQLGKIDAVIHTATCYGRKGESSTEILQANLVLPLKLLNAAIEAGVDLFINTDTVLDKFLNPYALSKGQFAEWGQFFADQKKILFLNLKLEHFYGPNDDPTKFTAHVINSCLNNAPELNLTLGEQQRDFIFINDVVSAYVLLLDKHNTFEENFVEFEIGSGIAVTIKKFVETAHRLTTSITRLNFGALPYRSGEAMYSKAKTDQLETLGWHCHYDIEAGITQIIKK
jgi:nucleoside-diphosphate-sugar epimerase